MNESNICDMWLDKSDMEDISMSNKIYLRVICQIDFTQSLPRTTIKDQVKKGTYESKH